MDTSKLKPNDPRVKYESTVVRGKTYSYILGEPQGPKRDTIILCHGWPDLGFGWRCQIPYLMSLGFQVVAPNMLGYPGTDSPKDGSLYSLKSMSDDIRELAKKFVGEHGQIIIGGHDWGAAFVWRVAYWHPRLVKAVFAACFPAFQPSLEFTELDVLIKNGQFPTFGYQLQFASPEPQEFFQGREKLRSFFRIINITQTTDGLPAFTIKDGFHFDRVQNLTGDCYNMTNEEIEHYVDQFSKQKSPELEGPFNWYRNRRYVYEEELERVKSGHPFFFEMPALYFSATHDAAVPPYLAKGMDKYFSNLTKEELETTHWILNEAPDEFNACLGKWLDTTVYKGGLKAML